MKTAKNRFVYCPIVESQRQLGLYLTVAGYETTRPREEYPHSYHSSNYYFTWNKGYQLPDDEYQLLYIRSGQGEIEFTGGRCFTLKAGTAILFHPSEWHRHRPNPKIGWSEAYIGFGGEIVRRFIDTSAFKDGPIVIPLEDSEAFECEFMDSVNDILTNNAVHPRSLALEVLALVMRLTTTATSRQGGSEHFTKIRLAHLYMGHHLDEPIDLQALAERIGMGYPLFRKHFAAYTGMPPLEFLLTLRLRTARHLLTNTSKPIAQIARETGFQSPAYFARIFHRETGLSPREFRNQGE